MVSKDVYFNININITVFNNHMHIYFIYMYISIFNKKIISLSYFNLNSVKFIIWKMEKTRM